MSTYLDIVDAVGAYYGTGSDQWVEIAKYGIHADNAASIISQVPGASVIYNNAGQITGFTYENPFSLGNGGAAGLINSNAQTATQAAGNTFKASIPATSSIDGQTGNMVMTSGAKAVSGGATIAAVLDKVHVGVLGVTIGAKLGAFIDSAIYNAAPNFWDEVAPTINPQTWDTIARTEYGKSMINSLFGIDKNTGATTMYVPKDAMSYLAYMMKQQGFFNNGTIVVPDYKDSGTAVVTGGLTAPSLYDWALGCLTRQISAYAGDSSSIISTFLSNNANNFAYAKSYTGEVSASSPSEYIEIQAFTTIRTGNTINLSTGYYSTNSLYVQLQLLSASGTLKVTRARSTTSTKRAWLGEYTQSGVFKYLSGLNATQAPSHAGVTPQPGQSFPDTSAWTDQAATDTALQALFPDDYNNNAVYIDVPQADGTSVRTIYIPVPTIATTGAGETQPTNTTITYNETVVNDDSPDSLTNTIIRYILEESTDTPSDDPDLPQDDNPPDTGDGDTPVVVTPTGQASALWAIYNPSQSQIDSFGGWLWSSNFIDQVLKLFNNPMQAIIGLHKIFATPDISGTGTIVVGYLDSGVSSNLVGSQYTDIDCGTVNVFEYFGNVFDYTETHIQLYLPFIGIVALDTADIMRSSVKVLYHVDVITGACLAEVKVTRDASGGTLYQYAGDAAVRYPISSGSYMGVVSGILTAAGSVASAIMTGGATLPMAAGAVVGGISSARTNIQHSGNFSGNAGAMGAKKPYLIIERPQSYMAQGYEGYQGIGENMVRTVSQMAGYFKMTDVRLNSVVGAADEELEIIRAALESGVII